MNPKVLVEIVSMKSLVFVWIILLQGIDGFCWGFYAHRLINQQAIFLLPPDMLIFYKPHLAFLTEHAVDPDKRRYAIEEEAPRHYIDMDHYGTAPFDNLPRKWKEAVNCYTEDSLRVHGIVPWWIQVMLARLTNAFREKNQWRILKLSAELGHYLADAHVPLHTSSNHNGQFTNQHGIHGFWESVIPELLAEKEWDLLLPRAALISDPLGYAWATVLASAAATDTVLDFERRLTKKFPPDRKYAYRLRAGQMLRQYSEAYTIAYDRMMDHMVERKLRHSISTVASFWYTAWVNAGQPDLSAMSGKDQDEDQKKEFDNLNREWEKGNPRGKSCG
jgi:hypothetical protein